MQKELTFDPLQVKTLQDNIKKLHKQKKRVAKLQAVAISEAERNVYKRYLAIVNEKIISERKKLIEEGKEFKVKECE